MTDHPQQSFLEKLSVLGSQAQARATLMSSVISEFNARLQLGQDVADVTARAHEALDEHLASIAAIHRHARSTIEGQG